MIMGYLREALWFVGEEDNRFYDREISQFFEEVSKPDSSNGAVICKQDPEGKPYYTTKIGCAPLSFTNVPDVMLHEGVVFATSDGEFASDMVYPSIEDATNSLNVDNPRIQEAIDAVEAGKDKAELNDHAQDFFEWRNANRPFQHVTPQVT